MGRNKSVSQAPWAQGGKQVMRMPKGAKPPQTMEPPKLPEAKPGAAKLAYGAFWGIMAIGLSVNLTLMYLLGTNLWSSLHPEAATSINWLAVVALGALMVFLVVALRAVIWGAFVGAVTVAGKVFAFDAQEILSRQAMRFRWLMPDKAAWASQAIVQLYLMRGEYDKVIDFGTDEYEKVFSKNPKDSTGAGLSAFIGFAYLAKGDPANAIIWNERSATKYREVFESMEKSKTAKKLVNAEVIAAMRTQYAGVLCQLGQGYLYKNNRRKSADCFKEALETARALKDSPEKAQVIAGCEQGLAQLKHW
ncbi:MAG: hypothetical protein J0H83_03225 [Candidatus Melainabacteria bacterium]|jgi:hypothetical protein|nr:hypothetical protein [Candidatus Melainabacteria bacterium]MBX9674762.1 hypothetical protein [Candidatus Obscuribacterales bacterium]